ncbi:MAG: mannitol dehydrogenase family protein, partial [Treponemataceae bacterium]|nr:mannitol dehydrogenase family protein [Treponemataceae bacterium]
MKLTLDGLKDSEGWKKAGVEIPAYDIEEMRKYTVQNPAWVHFGAGNIFRMFIGSLAEKLLNTGSSKTGIICAETFSFDMIEQIYNPYDNLVLGVTLKPDGNVSKQVIASLAEAIASTPAKAENWKRMKEIFAFPGLQMASFTITEKGYALKNAEGKYFPYILNDVEKGPEAATSAMGQITALLWHRFTNGAHPIAVVSMDNCSHNGEKLKSSVVDFAEKWLEKGYVSKEFVDYVCNEKVVSFPWSMIDKITPRPSVEIGKRLEA